MDNAKKREYILGVVILLSGMGYMFLAGNLKLPHRQSEYVNAAFIPYVLSGIMCILGVLQLRAAKHYIPKSDEDQDKVDYPTVWKTIGLIISYVILMNDLGFPLATVLYLVAQFTLLTPHDKRPNYLLYIVIALVASASIYLTFRYAFDMVLPVGPFDF